MVLAARPVRRVVGLTTIDRSGCGVILVVEYGDGCVS